MDISEILRQLHGVLKRTSRVRTDHIRDQKLVHMAALIHPVVALHKLPVHAVLRLAHHIEHPLRHMLRSDLQLPGNMIAHKLPQKVIAFVQTHVVKPDAGAHKHLPDTRDRPEFFQKVRVGHMGHLKIPARLRPEALAVRTYSLRELLFAGRLVKIRSRSAYIVDVPFEQWVFCHPLRLRQDGLVGARLHDSPLVKRQRAEAAASEAPPV